MKTDKNNNLKSYIEECAENWLKASMSNLNSDLGIISNILSSFIILRSIEEDIHIVTDIRAHIKKLFKDQEQWLLSSENAINIMAPVRKEVKVIIDYTKPESIEKFHEDLFESLFDNYDNNKLEETMTLLRKRLKTNGLDENFFKEKVCLDMGCGGGRFAFVMSQLGAKNVIGSDVGKRSLNSAKINSKKLKLNNTSFIDINSYNTDLKNNQFDFIVSNGVLHHHTNLEKVLLNIYQLLTSDGILWLYMEGELTGVINLVREQVKKVMKYIPIQFTKEIFTKAQVPPNSYNYILDGMYAIYFYHSKIYMKNILKELGFKKFQELEDDSIDINNNVLRNEIRIMCYK